MAQIAPDRVLVTGWATDFCVDATVRSAVSIGHHVVVVGDGHTRSDRPHLDAPTVITHHNWVWSGLITDLTPSWARHIRSMLRNASGLHDARTSLKIVRPTK